MRQVLVPLLILVVAVPLVSQAPAEKWTVGTVMAIKPHVPAATADAGQQFDVTVRIARTDYVVLYTEQPGTPGVEYAEGRDAPVLVGGTTLSFRDKLGRKVDLPIVSKKPAGTQSKDR